MRAFDFTQRSKDIEANYMEAETKEDPSKKFRDKNDSQKKMLQKLTLAMMQRGCASGLDVDEMQLLKESLLVLGWLPSELVSK